MACTTISLRCSRVHSCLQRNVATAGAAKFKRMLKVEAERMRTAAVEAAPGEEAARTPTPLQPMCLLLSSAARRGRRRLADKRESRPGP